MLDPRIIALMHLETLDQRPTSAEVAHLFGNDANALRYAISFDAGQESAWSAAALDE